MRQLIRNATPFDIPPLIEMLKQYRGQMPYGFLQDADDESHVAQMLTNLMAGQGIVLVAVDGEIIGTLIAGIAPSLWSPKHLLLTEFAYWVNPESRGGTAGYRLLKEYLKQGTEMKQAGRVSCMVISKMVNSPALNYDKFGFRKLEEFWVM